MTVRKRRRQRKFGFAHVVDLAMMIDLHDVFPDTEEGFEARREAWPILREECYKLVRSRWKYASRQIRPRGWWDLESPEPLDSNFVLNRRAEAEQLIRMEAEGQIQLDDEERAYIARSLEAEREAEEKRESIQQHLESPEGLTDAR